MVDTGKKTALDDNADIYNMPVDGERSEHEKWAKLNRLERVQYFKDYYLKKVIVTGLIIVFFAALVITVISPHPHSVVSLAVINDYWDDDAVDSLCEKLSTQMDLDPKTQDVMIDDSYFFGKGTGVTSAGEDNAAVFEKFITLVMAGDINCVVCDKDRFNNFVKAGYFLTVPEVLGADTDKYSDRLLYGRTEDDTSDKAYGISMKGTTFLTDMKAYLPDTVLAFTASAKDEDIEYLKEFTEYALQ